MTVGKEIGTETFSFLPRLIRPTFLRASGARILARPTDSCDRGARALPALRTTTRSVTRAPGAGPADSVAFEIDRSARCRLPSASSGTRPARPHATTSIGVPARTRRATDGATGRHYAVGGPAGQKYRAWLYCRR